MNGFTLVEMLVVVAAIGIMAAVAIPSYNDYTTRGKIQEGTSALADGRVKMEQFFQDNRSYTSASLAASGCPTALSLASSTTYFNYTCNGLSATAYTITATGKASMLGYTYGINQANSKTSTVPAAWLPASTTNPVACWVVKKKSC